MSLIFKNNARSFQGVSLCGSISKIDDMPVNGRPSLFGIDSVHPMSPRNIWYVSVTPLGIKREWYACIYCFMFAPIIPIANYKLFINLQCM
jgi:hypothetical protein